MNRESRISRPTTSSSQFSDATAAEVPPGLGPHNHGSGIPPLPTRLQEKEGAIDGLQTSETIAAPQTVSKKESSSQDAMGAEEEGSFEVGFSGPDDPSHPHNWPVPERWYFTAIGGLLVLNSTFASVLPSNTVSDIQKDFGFGRELGIMIISFFVLGYCFGPILWGPLSEKYGRRWTMLLAFAPYTLFQIGCALSKNVWSLIIFRFLSGTFASCPLAVSGALIADIWDPKRRGIGLAVFALTPFAGPAIAPVIGGFIHVRQVDWRDVFWILFAFAGACWVLALLTLKETYAPYILVKKARKIRKETGDDRYYAPIERIEKGSFGHQAYDLVAKPFIMLAQEPMLFAITMYTSFIYGVLYLLFEAYPLVFASPKPEGHGFNAGISGLMFIPFFLGGVAAVTLYVFVINPRYAALADELAPQSPPPEARLEMTLIGSPILVIAFLWFGWTSYSWISFWSPMMAGTLIGAAFLLIFLGFINYMIDTYLKASATALAANTICRSLFGAGFPLFAIQMYENLGTRWATFLLAMLALLFAPLPYVLKMYGPKLRALSKNAPTLQQPRAA